MPRAVVSLVLLWAVLWAMLAVQILRAVLRLLPCYAAVLCLAEYFRSSGDGFAQLLAYLPSH